MTEVLGLARAKIFNFELKSKFIELKGLEEILEYIIPNAKSKLHEHSKHKTTNFLLPNSTKLN